MDNRHIQCQASALPLPLTPSAEKGRDGVMARRYNLVAIYSFGSRAREVAAQVAGEAAEVSYPGSDVDIGVLPAPGQHLTAAERADLTVALEDLLELGQVDMVILPEAPPFLALDIVRGELLYTTDPVAEAEYLCSLYNVNCVLSAKRTKKQFLSSCAASPRQCASLSSASLRERRRAKS
jgi:predicted nucleotidyltransferase